jgi:hypothetical protein
LKKEFRFPINPDENDDRELKEKINGIAIIAATISQPQLRIRRQRLKLTMSEFALEDSVFSISERSETPAVFALSDAIPNAIRAKRTKSFFSLYEQYKSVIQKIMYKKSMIVFKSVRSLIFIKQ